MGMAYPLILQAIQRIDEMYKSTKLAAFFLKQWFFRLFSGLLLLTIPVSITAPFLLYYYRDFSWLMVLSATHAIIVFALAISAFILFKYIIMTTNPRKFTKYLEHKLNGGHPPLTEIFQILKYASDKEDDELFDYAAGIIQVYLVAYRKNKDDETATEVWKMLRELYKQHSKRDNHFFSTRNLIATYFLPVVEHIDLSEEEYIYIWQSVDAVLHAENESWVCAYWAYADQYYSFTLDNYADDNQQLKYQKERFKEQHFMIGALLTFNKRYDLLGKLMYFSNSLPPRYNLVPSTYISIISQLKRLLKMKDYTLTMTKRYLMIGAPQDVSSDNFILHNAYKYASLLLIRLFTVNNWNYTYSNPMDLPKISSAYKVEDLNDEAFMMNRLKKNISSWFEDKDAIKKTIGEDRVQKDEVIELCDTYITQCKNKIEEFNKSTEVDPEKVKYIKNNLLNALKEYPLRLPILQDNTEDGYKKQLVHNYIQYQIDKEILKVGTYTNASNLPEVLVEHMNENVYKAYNFLFLLQSSVRNVRIAYKDIKRVLNVIDVSDNYAALSLGVYLGNYEDLYGKEGDVKFVEQDAYRSYKGCNIYSIPSTQQCIVVIKKCDMPFVKKEKLSDSHKLALLDNDEYFYSNIDDLKDLSDENNQNLYVDRGIYIYSKEKFRYIRLIIDYNPGFETDIKKVEEAREITWP